MFWVHGNWSTRKSSGSFYFLFPHYGPGSELGKIRICWRVESYRHMENSSGKRSVGNTSDIFPVTWQGFEASSNKTNFWKNGFTFQAERKRMAGHKDQSSRDLSLEALSCLCKVLSGYRAYCGIHASSPEKKSSTTYALPGLWGTLSGLFVISHFSHCGQRRWVYSIFSSEIIDTNKICME